MGKELDSVKEIWEKYLKSIGEKVESTKLTYESWYFGYNEELVNSLVKLVINGEFNEDMLVVCEEFEVVYK